MMGIVMTATTNINRKKSGCRAFFVARLVVVKVNYFVDYFTEAMVGLYN